MVMVSAHATSAIDGDDLPPAKPGQCFTKAFFPAKYTTIQKKYWLVNRVKKLLLFQQDMSGILKKLKLVMELKDSLFNHLNIKLLMRKYW